MPMCLEMVLYQETIPYICHFFYTDRIFENQILHPKKRLKSPKTLKMSLKKSYICIFFTHSGKIYTWQKIFTQTCLWCLWQIKGMVLNCLVINSSGGNMFGLWTSKVSKLMVWFWKLNICIYQRLEAISIAIHGNVDEQENVLLPPKLQRRGLVF